MYDIVPKIKRFDIKPIIPEYIDNIVKYEWRLYVSKKEILLEPKGNEKKIKFITSINSNHLTPKELFKNVSKLKMWLDEKNFKKSIKRKKDKIKILIFKFLKIFWKINKTNCVNKIIVII